MGFYISHIVIFSYYHFNNIITLLLIFIMLILFCVISLYTFSYMCNLYLVCAVSQYYTIIVLAM